MSRILPVLLVAALLPACATSGGLREEPGDGPPVREEPATTAAPVRLLEPPPATPPVDGEPAPDLRRPPSPPPPARPAEVLGPTAVVDPGQVRKVVAHLNALLGRAGGTWAWKVLEAGAVDGDRLVGAVVECLPAEGGLSRTFRAEEARFVLRTSARALEIRLRGGSVSYGGARTVEFPDGRYTATVEVDPEPLRTSGNPLIDVR